MHSALHSFDSEATRLFFTEAGVPLKIERGRRVFPVSDRSKDVVDSLLALLAKARVDLRVGERVLDVVADSGRIAGVRTEKEFYACDKVILAAGGKSYPGTGSSGDGYVMAEKLGHTISPLFPALVPLVIEEEQFFKLSGLTLKNVRITLLADGKKVDDAFGEMLFTHFGVSGPIILTLSRKAVLCLREQKTTELSLDLKPALSAEQLNQRVERDFLKYRRKRVKGGLIDLLPKSLIEPVTDIAYLDCEKTVSSVTAKERDRLVKTLKGLVFTVSRARPLAEAIVTAGGVVTKEINPKTMESKLISGLYFAGEVVDVDGVTGGYNLQAAFSMGVAAGTWSARA